MRPFVLAGERIAQARKWNCNYCPHTYHSPKEILGFKGEVGKNGSFPDWRCSNRDDETSSQVRHGPPRGTTRRSSLTLHWILPWYILSFSVLPFLFLLRHDHEVLGLFDLMHSVLLKTNDQPLTCFDVNLFETKKCGKEVFSFRNFSETDRRTFLQTTIPDLRPWLVKIKIIFFTRLSTKPRTKFPIL